MLDRILLQRLLNRSRDNFLHLLPQFIDFSARNVCGLNRVVQYHGDLARIDHPVTGLKKLVRTDDTHRHDGNSEFLREVEHSFLEFVHEPVARARSFRERDQANTLVKSGLRALGHDLEALARGRVRYGHVAEPAHDPAIDRQLEMRFELEAANELRNRGINYEGVENIHMV